MRAGRAIASPGYGVDATLDRLDADIAAYTHALQRQALKTFQGLVCALIALSPAVQAQDIPANTAFVIAADHADTLDANGQVVPVTGFRLERNSQIVLEVPASQRVNGVISFQFPSGWPAGSYAVRAGVYNSAGEAFSTPLAVTVGAGPAPDPTWTFCANEGEQCAFADTREVRYGANETFITRTLTGGTPCTNTVFTDPLPGVFKHCDTRPTTTNPPPPPPPPPDPCVADPLVIRRVTWPSTNTGRRSLTFDVGDKFWIGFTFDWPGVLIVTDTRGCRATVRR